jgi:hypothetical protein
MRLSELYVNKGGKASFDTTYDGIQPDEGYFDDLKVEVFYEHENLGTSHHPYGEGSAAENHGTSINFTDAKLTAPAELKNAESDAVIKSFAKGTSLKTLPGWDKGDEKYFQQLCEEHHNRQES